MASQPNVVFRPPKTGEAYDPKKVVETAEGIADFRRTDHSSKKGLEKLANQYMGSYITQLLDPDQVKRAVEFYGGYLSEGLGDYVLGGLSDAVKHVGPERVIPIALTLPTRKGAGSNPKYDTAVDLVAKLRGFDEEARAPNGVEKLIDAEFAKQDDFSKGVWIKALGGTQGVIEHIKVSRARKAAEAIGDYGVADYMKVALSISESAEKDYKKEMGTLQEKMEGDLEKMREGSAVAPTPSQFGEIRDKYEPQEEAINKKYENLLGARRMILEGSGRELPGIIALSIAKSKQKEKEDTKKAAAAK